jgi:hypothetical protein
VRTGLGSTQATAGSATRAAIAARAVPASGASISRTRAGSRSNGSAGGAGPPSPPARSARSAARGNPSSRRAATRRPSAATLTANAGAARADAAPPVEELAGDRQTTSSRARSVSHAPGAGGRKAATAKVQVRTLDARMALPAGKGRNGREVRNMRLSAARGRSKKSARPHFPAGPGNSFGGHELTGATGVVCPSRRARARVQPQW